MSEEQLKAFIAKLKDDQSIQDKIKSSKSPEDVLGIAKEHGHELATEHITELSEAELEGVAGGFGICGTGTFAPGQAKAFTCCGFGTAKSLFR